MSVGQETLDLGQCVSRLVHQGQPLASGLAALRRDLPAGKLRASLNEVVRRMERGQPVDAALAHGGRLPGTLHGLLLASLRAGAIDEILEELLRHQRRLADYRRNIVLAAAYPAILLAALAAVFLFICAAVVPRLYSEEEDLATVFGLRDTGLTAVTRMLLGISVLLREHTGWLAAAVVLLGIAGWLWMRFAGPTALPLIGPIWRHAQRAELVRLLGMMVRYEVPLPRALVLLAGDLSDRRLRTAAATAAAELEVGTPAAQALQRLTSPAKWEVVAWIHDHRSLAEGLEMIAATADGDARARLEMVRAMLAPAAFLAVILTVLVLLAGLFGPMLQALNVIGSL
jgi:general secretion pathway protein F